MARRAPIGAPPSWASAEWAAAQGDEDAARWLAGLGEALEGRERLIGVLEGCLAGEVVEQEPDPEDGPEPVKRSAVRSVDRIDPDTGEVTAEWAYPSARMIREDWLADPSRTAKAMRNCGRAYGVHRYSDGTWGAHPYGCGCPACPACSRSKAAASADYWATVIGKLVSGLGCELRHLTLTQRTNPGETLGEALERLGAAWALLRDSRRTREDWNDHALGYMLGTEWTARHPGNGARRWHAHLHVLAVCWPGMGDGLEQLVIPRWCEVADAHHRAQHVSNVDLGRALREVLKYPFKPLELDDEALCEVIVTTKGTRPKRSGGGLHGASRIGQCAAVYLGTREGCTLEGEGPRWACTDRDWAAGQLIAQARWEWDTTRPQPIYVARDTLPTLEDDPEDPSQDSSRRGDLTDAAGRVWSLVTVRLLESLEGGEEAPIVVSMDPGNPSAEQECRPGALLEGVSVWKNGTL